MDLDFNEETKVCLVRNLISPEACATLIDAVAALKADPEYRFNFGSGQQGESFWEEKNTSVYDLPGFDLELIYDIEKKEKEAFKEYAELLGLSANDYKLTSFATVHKWDVGSDMYVHKDSYDGDSRIKFGFVLYLNEDYEGGGIHYPEYNTTIQPTTGLLVMHPGDILHGVNEVTSGVRYNMTAFGLDASEEI
jgi:hypothetical protein